jgi:hypothetical protein
MFAFPFNRAFAHGTGAISLSTKQAAPGSSLMIRGTDFAKGSSVRLELRGVLDSFVFGRVQTSTKGTFQQSVTLPAGTKAGQYTVVALAPDGDVAAQATLMIAGSNVADDSHPGMHDMPGIQGMGGPHATAEMMDVAIPITALGWGVITAIILASAATGVWLLRSGRRAQGVGPIMDGYSP